MRVGEPEAFERMEVGLYAAPIPEEPRPLVPTRPGGAG